MVLYHCKYTYHAGQGYDRRLFQRASFSRFANKDVGVQEIVSRRNDGLPRNASTRVRGPVTVIAILF